MMSQEQNDLITRIGPKTPAGKLMRMYWQPAALAEELASERPVKEVRLLGDNFVLFRDAAGRYGLLDRDCPHPVVCMLDEQYSIGIFEDDDYAQRIRQAGLRVVCAEDAFVHHFGQTAFKQLSPSEYQAIWDRNQRLYERKWGVRWERHQTRD